MKNKGCFNENCKGYKRQFKYDSTIEHCPICRSELEYVCIDIECYSNLVTVRKHVCDDCRDTRERKKANRLNTAGVFVGIAGALIPIAKSTMPHMLKGINVLYKSIRKK